MHESPSSLTSKNPLHLPGVTPAQDPRRFSATRTGNTIQELFRIVAKRRIWLICSVVVAVVCSVVLTSMMKPVYQSTAVIELNKSSTGASALDIGGDMSSQMFSDGESLLTDLQTETAILQSDALTTDMIQRLGLMNLEPYASVIKTNPSLASEKGLPLARAPKTRETLVGMVGSKIKVQPVRGTRLIEVTVSDHDPQRAALIANGLIESYKNQYLQSHYSATAEVSDWLTKQLEDLKQNVEESQKKLTDFEKETGILTFDLVASGSDKDGGSGQAHSVVVQKLEALNSELTQAEANRIEKEAIYRLVKSGNADSILGVGKDPLAMTSNSAILTQGGGLSVLEGLRQQQGSLKMALVDAQSKYGPNNRHLKDLQTQDTELNRQIREEVQRIESRAAGDFQLAKQSEDAIRQQFQHQQDEANKLNGKAIELAVLSQEAASRKKLYEDLYTKLQEANISAGIKATNITVVDPGWASSSPVSPNLRRNIIFGLFGGVLFGVFASFLVDSLDRTVTTPDQIEEITGRAVVGTVPLLDDREKSAGSRLALAAGSRLPSVPAPGTIWVLHRPQSAIAEACRSLRTSVVLSRTAGGPKVILVTSSVPGEGKTTLTANLGVVFAQHGKKVLIIEGDMRRPTLKRVFGLDVTSGLSNVLTEGDDLDATIIRNVAVPSLDLLPAGPIPPLPSEILDSREFDSLLNAVRSRYDIVLIDSPPATVVTDAIPLALKSDGVLWIARAGQSTRPLVERSAEIIHKYQLPFIGFVMNGVDFRSVDYQYSYYGYAGSHGYYKDKNS
jgi:polysaccharide biosynthesis transport protein